MVRSLRTRLLVGAVLWIVAGLAVAGLSISSLFRAHVIELIDNELVGHLDELSTLLVAAPDGSVTLQRRLSDPRFSRPGSGFYWQVSGPNRALLRSTTLAGHAALPAPRVADGQTMRRVLAHPGDGSIIYERVWRSRSDLRYVVQVAADRRFVNGVLAHFNRALAISFGLLSVALVAAAVLQVGFGLAPVRRMQKALADVRSGKTTRLPVNFPSEVQPFVDDLNALLEANAEILRRARIQAGNLAHALKTPLAILSDEARLMAARGDAAGSAVVQQQSMRMTSQIEYQLARARSAASAGTPGSISPLRPTVEAVVAAMRRLHAGRHLDIGTSYCPHDVVKVDAPDLSEMIANLIDNACKWADSTVRIDVTRSLEDILVLIDNDGSPIPSDALDRIFGVGERLDESKPGAGLGLAIVRDLAAIHNGNIALTNLPGRGVRATLRLPAL